MQLGMSALCHKRTSRYSINSSARAARVGGTSRPSAFAVLRLITNSNLVDCTTGRSTGLAPLRTRVNADLTIGVGKARSVTHQTTCCGKVTPFKDRRYCMARRQHDKLLAPAVKEWRAADEERRSPLTDKGRERGVEIAFRIGAHDNKLHLKAGSRLLYVAQLAFGIRKVRVDEHRDGRGLGNVRAFNSTFQSERF